MKTQKIFFLIFIIINLYNCKMNNDMIILPIDEEFNEQWITGKGLDSNLFSRKEVVQYYTIKGYDYTLTNEFKSKIEKFILEKYNYNEVIKKKLHFYFIRKIFLQIINKIYMNRQEIIKMDLLKVINKI
jgi:hypothetical protein